MNDDEPKSLRDELRSEAKDYIADVQKRAEKGVSKSQLRRELLKMTGQSKRNGFAAFLESLRWRPIMVSTASFAVICLLIALNFPSGEEFSWRRDDRGVEVHLPNRLKINFKSGTIVLSGDGDRLKGTWRLLQSEPDKTTYEISVSGSDSDGRKVSLKGRATIYPKQAGQPANVKNDVSKIVIEATFDIQGVGPVPVSPQTYIP